MRILHYLSLLCVLILLQSCLQDDLRTPVVREATQEDPLNAQTLIMDQTTLEERYAGNTSLEHLFEKDFKKAVSSLSAAKGGSNRTATLDLEHIQVLEADKVHVITYRVQVTDEKEPESKAVYNLVYYSTDRKEYYVTLLKYDFSRISIEQYLKKPTAEVLYLYPLEEDRDTDKNIQYAISSVSPIFVYEIIPPGDCMKEVSVAGTPCKGSGNPKHEYGDNSCSMTGNKRATPGYTYMDFSDCGKNSGGGSGGGGSYPGGGGGGGSTPGPGSPGGPPAAGGGNPPISVVKPIKNIGDLVKSKILIGQVNMGSGNTNAKVLKAVSSFLKQDIQTLYGRMNDTRESGFAYQFGIVNGSYTYNVLGGRLILTSPNYTNRKIELGNVSGRFSGAVHNHTDNLGVTATEVGTPLFSPPDLGAVFKFTNKSVEDPFRQPAEAFVGVVNRYGMYMVMLPNNVTSENINTKYSDFTKIIQFGSSKRIVVDKEKQKWREMENELERKYYDIELINDPEHIKKKKYERALLMVLKKYKLEMNIYFLDANEGSFNGNWQQLSIKNSQIQYTNIN
ncbi:hypothetical protein [Paenimyroides ceti]